jgi:acyl-homoserine lactone synthase
MGMHVHLVNAANRHQYLDELEAMHRHRHRVFVDLMGWKALASPDSLDIDRFDTPDATYLIAIDEGGVRGSCRMIPTWRPHMLNSIFEHFLDGPPQVGPGLWEWSRHVPGDPAFPKEVNHQARFLLSIAALEFAASRGIDGYVGIVDTVFVARTIDLGWKVDPIGLPRTYDEGSAYAFRMDVAPGHAQQLRQRLSRTDPALIELPSGLSPLRAKLARRTLELAISVSPQTVGRAEAALRELAETLE